MADSIAAAPEFDFSVEDARPLEASAAPHLLFRIRIAQTARNSIIVPIQSVLLQCQVRIEPARRRYNDEEQRGLYDLFGEPRRWAETVKSILWSNCTATVAAFDAETTVDLPVACTYDLNLAAIKYFSALRSGEIPLEFLFSGSVFYLDRAMLRVARIAWDRQAEFRLPLPVWNNIIERYYSNVAWLGLRRDVFERLYRHKCRFAMTSFEQAVEHLLAHFEERCGS